MIRGVYRLIVPKTVRESINRFRYNARGRTRAPIVALTDPLYRQRGARLQSLRDIYRGRRCFIMGNGPSLNEMNLRAFEGEYVWASNRAYLLFDRIPWRPAFWVAVDRRVVPDIAAELMAVQESLPRTLFFYPDAFRLTGTLRSLPNTYWFRERHDPDRVPRGVFSLDVPDYVASVKTVTITAIQLAVHLGFNPIYLFGCDTTYRLPTSTKLENSNAEHLISTTDDDPNHFDRTYFGAGRRWHNPHPDRMITHYQHVDEIAKSEGIEIVNLTLGGALDVFPRGDYLDVL